VFFLSGAVSKKPHSQEQPHLPSPPNDGGLLYCHEDLFGGAGNLLDDLTFDFNHPFPLGSSEDAQSIDNIVVPFSFDLSNHPFGSLEI
jgi:hypothetical protein